MKLDSGENMSDTISGQDATFYELYREAGERKAKIQDLKEAMVSQHSFKPHLIANNHKKRPAFLKRMAADVQMR